MNNLSIINKLQEICANTTSVINLPQIVVVGAQSSGKTSILESIVGKDFLPRGSGIVTRRPLILQLKNVPGGKEWAEFSHTGREKFEDFSKVHDEIEKETMRIAGVNKGISSEPIILKVFSPQLVDLTLVDLPGVVKVPIGDQPHDIENIVKELLVKYISNPNAIILAITPGNTDIANSDALKLAKEVDPQFQRTIGVITKLDLITQDADVKNTIDVLNNKTFPLKLGYIGVVCRTNSKNSIQDAVALEEEFFDGRIDYKGVRHLLGIKYLTQSLSSYLMEHIKSNLPSIKDSIANEIYQKENELNTLGQDNGFDRQEVLNSYVLMLVFKFANTYKEMIEGNLVKECSKFFIGGARINYIFQEIFRKEINQIDPYDTLTDEDIRTAIRNTNGLKPSLFIPEGAFEVLIKQQINRLTKPSIICVKKVYEELKNIVAQIELPELHRYKKLEIKIREIMDNVLDRCLEPTNQMISNLIDIEQSYINTTHPDFLGPEQSFMNIFDDSLQGMNNNMNNLNIQGENGNRSGGNFIFTKICKCLLETQRRAN
jgi:dynamin 1-like protein